MRAALAVNKVGRDVEVNLTTIVGMAEEAAHSGAQLVVFPEAALTGLINNDDPTHDLPFGQTIPGPATDVLSRATREHDLWLAIGLLELDGDRLFDSAVLLGPDGQIALKYRRNQPQWHGKDADPMVYCQGSEVPKADTPLGRFTILICGDLFDDAIVQKARSLQPDWVLLPFARSFGDRSVDQARWDREEVPEYTKRATMTGATCLMVNYLGGKDLEEDATFGGAMVVSTRGEIIDRLPLGETGLLMVDLEKTVK
jgi:predicted amidohydrolase